VNKVAISDMFEIQSSQLALSKEADADTKPFAEKMVQDHQKTSSELKGLVEGSMVKLTLPTRLDAEHQQMLNELNAKSGKDFDQTYDQIQVKAHRVAVALFEAYSKSGLGSGRPRGQLRWPGAPQDSSAHWHVGEFQVRLHGAKHETPTAHVAPTYELRREKKLLRKGREQHI